MSSLRVGVIGLGGVARWTHLPAMEKIDPEVAKLVAVCDVREDLVSEVTGNMATKGYTDPIRMVEEADLDCVIVGIPPHLHGDLEHRCVVRKLPFFMEKPAHRDIRRALEIAEKVRTAGLIAGVGYMDRYQDTHQHAKAFLAESPAGAFTGYWVGGIYNVPWWIKRDQGGGQHFEQTTHIFDLSRFYFGDVVEVFARGMAGLNTDVEGYDIEDASCVTLVFESGLVGVVWSGCFMRGGPGRNGLDVFTRFGKVEVHNRSHVVIDRGTSSQMWRNTADTAVAEDLAFFEAVCANDASKMLSPYADGVKSLALSAAASESMASGKPVKPAA